MVSSGLILFEYSIYKHILNSPYTVTVRYGCQRYPRVNMKGSAGFVVFYLKLSVRQGKLNSLFIVTARMDFRFSQKFSDFIFNIVNIWQSEPHPLIMLIRRRGLAILRFEHSFPALSTGLKYEK